MVPSPHVVDQVDHTDHVDQLASTLQQVPPVSMVRESLLLPGQSEPPHAAVQVRLRVLVPVWVRQVALQPDQGFQTPLTALMQQLVSV